MTGWSATLVTATSGQLTVTVAVALLLPLLSAGSLLALTRAVFVTIPQAAGGASTVMVMTTVSEPVSGTPSSAARPGRARWIVLPGPGGMVPVPPGVPGSTS